METRGVGRPPTSTTDDCPQGSPLALEEVASRDESWGPGPPGVPPAARVTLKRRASSPASGRAWERGAPGRSRSAGRGRRLLGWTRFQPVHERRTGRREPGCPGPGLTRLRRLGAGPESYAPPRRAGQFVASALIFGLQTEPVTNDPLRLLVDGKPLSQRGPGSLCLSTPRALLSAPLSSTPEACRGPCIWVR